MAHDHELQAAAIARGFPRPVPLPAWARGVAARATPSLVIYGAFVLLLGLPLLLVLVQAVMPGLFDVRAPSMAISLVPLERALASPRVAESVMHSFELALATAVSATALGGAFAVLAQRCDVPGKRLIAMLPWLVFLTPSYLKALAWVLLMSPGGYLAQLGLLPEGIHHAFFALPGLVFVQTLSLFPLASFVIGSALAGLGSEYEDAARMAGAAPLRIWIRINGPLVLPAIALSVIAIFAEVLSDFGMASTIARVSNFSVLTYGIYAAASDYPVDFPMAGTQALILLLLVAAVVVADRLLRRRADPRLISGRSRAVRRYRLGPWRWVAAIIVGTIGVLALGLPILAITARSFTGTLGAGLAPGNLTLVNVLAALSPGSDASAALGRSLGFAGVTALIACTAALLLAIEVERSKGLMRPLVLGLSLGAVAIPGIVLGFGYILLWNRLPGFRDWPFPHYGDASLLVTGYVAAALPYCLVIILGAIGQLAPSLNESARLFGVGGGRRVLRITLPLVFLSVMTAFLLTFIRTVFELPISQMLVPLSGPPVPPMVTGLFGHDRDGLGSALSLVSMALAGGGAGIVWFVATRYFGRRAGGPASSMPAPGGVSP
ncbi:MAG: ABC transporter permease subunit [Devosia sp.]|nr:ABC transporter permease subunit [Devosia sp.]